MCRDMYVFTVCGLFQQSGSLSASQVYSIFSKKLFWNAEDCMSAVSTCLYRGGYVCTCICYDLIHNLTHFEAGQPALKWVNPLRNRLTSFATSSSPWVVN